MANSAFFPRNSWNNIFIDRESGNAFHEWAIGSNRGHADIMPFVRTEQEMGSTDLNEGNKLLEGHSYFIVVKVNTLNLYNGYKVGFAVP